MRAEVASFLMNIKYIKEKIFRDIIPDFQNFFPIPKIPIIGGIRFFSVGNAIDLHNHINFREIINIFQ